MPRSPTPLGYPRDTLRRYRAFDRGEMIWNEQIDGPRERGPGPPLPRVYGPRQDEPRFTWVNLPLTAITRPREVLQQVELSLWAKIKELDGAEATIGQNVTTT